MAEDWAGATWGDLGIIPPGVGVSSSAVIPEYMHPFLQRLRAAVPSSVPLYITSGSRSPEAQAGALVTKRNQKDDLFALYSKANHDIVRELMAAPNTVAGMAPVLRKYIAQDRWLSRHMRNPADAFDLRVHDWTAAQEQLVKAAAARLGVKANREYKPPHLHLEGVLTAAEKARALAGRVVDAGQNVAAAGVAAGSAEAKKLAKTAKLRAKRARAKARKHKRLILGVSIGSGLLGLVVLGLLVRYARKGRKSAGAALPTPSPLPTGAL